MPVFATYADNIADILRFIDIWYAFATPLLLAITIQLAVIIDTHFHWFLSAAEHRCHWLAFHTWGLIIFAGHCHCWLPLRCLIRLHNYATDITPAVITAIAITHYWLMLPPLMPADTLHYELMPLPADTATPRDADNRATMSLYYWLLLLPCHISSLLIFIATEFISYMPHYADD